MRSSGIKRSMAAIAISAVAVAGIPALAMANTIDSQVTGALGPTIVQLYNINGGGIDLTAKNDGTDSTVRLEAGGGINVAQVTFQVSRNGGAFADIATVGRNDDGAFSVEWTPADSGAFAGDTIRLRAFNPVNPPATFDVSGPMILRNASAAATQAINITAGEQKGYFRDPDALTNYTLGVTGTTTVTSTNVLNAPGVAWMDGFGAEQNFTFDTSNSGTGTWEGVLRFTTPNYVFDDPALPPVEADQMVVRARTDTVAGNDDTDDFEGFTLYRQTLTSLTATLAPATEPDPGTVTVTVLDQNGAPIAGIDVYRENGTFVDESDGRGQVTTPQNDNVRYYYANADAADAFSPGAGDKRSNDVNNLAAVVDITTAPSDGDVPIGTTVTETIKVTDTNGDPISNRPVRIKRTGPSDNGETVFKTTNDNGELTYTFNCNVEGVAMLEVGISGPVAPLADPFTFAIGYDTVNCQNPPPPPGPVAINAKLRGHSSQGRDVLTVNAPGIAEGATVRLQKRANGRWVTIKTKTLDGAGDRKMGVKDRNGKKVTKYRAKVSPTSRTFADTTPFKRLK